jgi:hypothetical protein
MRPCLLPLPLLLPLLNRAGLFVVVGLFGAVPLWMKHRQVESMTAQAAPLGGAVMRGAYMNYGSKDVGVDPDWDLKVGRWKGLEGKESRFNPTADDLALARRAVEARLRAEGLLKGEGGGDKGAA